MDMIDIVDFRDILAPMHTPEFALLDPSMLNYMSSVPVSGRFPHQTKLLVPKNFLSLIERIDDPKYLVFLQQFLRFFDYQGLFQQVKYFDVSLLLRNINFLQKSGALYFVDVLEDDHILREELSEALEVSRFYMGFSPKRNFLKDYILTILEISRKKRCAILMKTRRSPAILRDHILTLEIPSRIDQIVQMKVSFTSQLFDIPYGKSIKFFIGVSLSAAGFFHPVPGIAGLLLAFTDP